MNHHRNELNVLLKSKYYLKNGLFYVTDNLDLNFYYRSNYLK